MIVTSEYDVAMRRALELAANGPATGVNPRVGCVVLDAAGTVISEGWHRGVGTPHAECDALSRIDPEQSHGATAVVTLEPCNHYGHTPPCTEALIAAGVSRVVYAVSDPGHESGGGAARLRAAGIQVMAGVLADEVTDFLGDWLRVAALGRPVVTLKWASSLDGRAAAADGSSRWITGTAARQKVHEQREAADAIIVGTGTILADDPALTARGDGGELMPRQPIPVVIGRRTVPADAAVRHHPREPIFATGRDLADTLNELRKRGIRRAFVEGGPTLASAFVAAGLVDEYVIYLAPTLIGGPRVALGDLGVGTIGEQRRLEIASVEQLGQDLLIVAKPATSQVPGSTERRNGMFTGIIEELGTVERIDRGRDAARLTIAGPRVVADVAHGDSISVSGVCLTVIDNDARTFTADVMAESLEASTLGDIEAGTPVNLERAAPIAGRINGHIVQGHVDGTGRVLAVTEGSAWRVVRISLPPDLSPLVARKGSIAVDGVSLTVSGIAEPTAPEQWFEVSLIPETLSATTLGSRAAGDAVNLETDILARQLERMLAFGARSTETPAALTGAADQYYPRSGS